MTYKRTSIWCGQHRKGTHPSRWDPRSYRADRLTNPLPIHSLFDVADVAKARAWTEGADLRAAMEKAGVVSKPVIHFLG